MYWLIIERDKRDQESTRLRTREAHRDYIWRVDLPARLLVGSPLSDDDGAAMTGTWLLVEAPDRAAAEAFAEGDPYRKAGLFERVEIAALHPVFDPRSFGLRSPAVSGGEPEHP